VRSTSVGEDNETFFIRVWKPLPSIRVLKTLRGSPKEKTPKRTISANGVIVSELDIGRCAKEEAKPRREVDMRRCASKDVGT